MSDAELAPIARGQHGLLTTRQALTSLSPDQLKQRLRERRLEPVRRGVYRVSGAPESWHQQLLAACLAAGANARASFRSAAALYELEGFGPDILEISHLGGRPAELRGVVVHETSVFGPADTAMVLDIPTTSIARTLCDLTAAVPAWMVERAVDESLRRKLLTLKALARVAEAVEGQGRRRCTVMREVLANRLDGIESGDSAPEARVAIEYDGWDFHSTRTAFDDDRARANELEVMGWTVLRFTSRSSDATVVAVVGAVLARAAAS